MTRYSRSKGIAYPAPPADERGDGSDGDDERGDTDRAEDVDTSSGESEEPAAADD